MTAGEQPTTTAETLRRGIAIIKERLPADWAAELSKKPASSNEDPGRLLEISSPAQERALLLLEAKRSVAGRDVGELKRRLSNHLANLVSKNGESRAVVVAPYLSHPVRTRLQEANLSYVDLTGNLRIELSRPGLFLSDCGASTDPWRGPGRPRGTLKGEPAARIVRALTDFDRNWRMRELVDESGTSTGTAYRVVEHLEREGLAIRNGARMVHVTDWSRLLKAWSVDYGLIKSNRTTRWIAPRGIPELITRISQTTPQSFSPTFQYALTGTLAAAEWAAHAPASLVMAYVTDAEAAANAWGLKPAETGANVLLAEPSYEVVLERAWTNAAGVRIAAPSQVVVDLLTGPGRSPSEAEALLSWLRQSESAWRIHG